VREEDGILAVEVGLHIVVVLPIHRFGLYFCQDRWLIVPDQSIGWSCIALAMLEGCGLIGPNVRNVCCERTSTFACILFYVPGAALLEFFN